MSKQPWQEFYGILKTESSFWTYIRGVLRKGWSNYPVKLEFIKKHRKRIVNPVEKNRTRFPDCWGMTCALCNKDFAQKDIQIDHIGEGSSFTGLHDLEKYVSHLFLIGIDDIRSVCAQCHRIETHRQRKGITYEDAQIEKEIILIEQQESLDDILNFLYSYGYSEIQVSNTKKRRACMVEVFTNFTKGE